MHLIFNPLLVNMQWMVEIGRIDIAIEVSQLSYQLAYPQEGHLEATLHVMSYLEQKHNSRLIFDPTYPKIDESIFKDCYWKYLYGDAEEVIPPKALKPRGKVTDMKAKVDSYHAGDKENRRSRTGYLIFCNISFVD